MKDQVKDLVYYATNAEENYEETPISVLRYISELESAYSSLIDRVQLQVNELNGLTRQIENITKTIEVQSPEDSQSGIVEDDWPPLRWHATFKRLGLEGIHEGVKDDHHDEIILL